MTDIPGLPYDGVTDVVDESGNGKGVALNVWPSDNRVPIADDPVPLDSFVLAEAELAYAHTSQRLRVGDGYTPGGDEVAFTSDFYELRDIFYAIRDAIMDALSLKGNLDGGNTWNGNQIFNGNVTVNGSFNVTDEAFGPVWNGQTSVPTKNAVYDEVIKKANTTDVTASLALKANLAGGNAFTGNQTVTGTVTATDAIITPAHLKISAHSGFPGVASGNAYAYRDNVSGLCIYGEGSSFDFTALNKNGAGVFRILTGTQNVEFLGTIAATGAITSGGSVLATVSQLANYLPLTGGTISGGFTVSMASPQITMNPLSGACTFDLRGTNGSGTDGMRLQGIAAGGNIKADTVTFYNRATTATFATIDATGINLPTGLTYKINGVPIGSGGGGAVSDAVYGVSWDGDTTTAPSKNAVYDKIQSLIVGGGSTLADGDYGDVLVGGTGTTMTVQSAAGDFIVNGALDVKADAALLRFYNASGVLQTEIMAHSPTAAIYYDHKLGAGSHVFRIAGTNIATVNSAGLAVTGNITATGTITSAGAPLATVSQLANYLPLTGGGLSGNLSTSGSIVASTGFTSVNAGPVTLYSAYYAGDTITLANSINFGGVYKQGLLSNNTAGGFRDFWIGSTTLSWVAADGYVHATFSTAGLEVSGTISANGSPLATVSQLASYMPLTGGTFSGQVNHDNNINYFGKSSGAAQDSLTVFRNCATYSTFWFNSYDTAGANEIQDGLITSYRGYGMIYDAKPNMEFKINGIQKLILTSTGAAVTGTLTVTDDVYAAGWNGSTAVPTKNAVYDKIEALAATIPAAPSTVISDVAYAASWNAVTTIAPSKNAVYDQMELKANIAPGVGTSTSAATLVPVATNDMTTRTTQTVALSVSAPTGTPVNGFGHVIRIKATAAITVSWNAIYRAIGITLPTAIALNKTIYVGMIYNSADSTWDCTSLSVMA